MDIKALIHRLICLLAVLTFKKNQIDAGTIRKIVGGRTTNRQNWPWQASLVVTVPTGRPKQKLCGGTLVSPYWVLTTGHCVREYEAITVIFNTFSNTSQRNHAVVDVRTHPCYDPANPRHGVDLALVRLRTPEHRSNVVCMDGSLLRREWLLFIDGGSLRDCIATGYGTRDGNVSRFSFTLQEVLFPFVSKRRCERYYADQISDDKICSYGAHGRDTCNGDEGGPLVCPVTTNRSACRGYHLVGVIQGGRIPCGVAPTVHTAISPNYRWIRETVSNYNSINDAPQLTTCTGIAAPKNTNPTPTRNNSTDLVDELHANGQSNNHTND